MNWSKNLYVFMLGALIVFSGCFGTGTTDGEGDADTAGTTVINNYYNNTTEVITELPEMISLGGFVTGGQGGTHNITTTINTTAGQMIHIDEARIICDNSCYIAWVNTCTNGANFTIYAAGSGNGESLNEIVNGYIPGSASDCTHTIDIYDGTTTPQEISWSLVYSIHPVTVG